MANELVYTSAEHGLKPRSHGFCTVAMTRGLMPNLIEQLEGLSGYRAHFPAHDPRAASNPVNYSYSRFVIGGRDCPLLSRVCFAGFDYTGRSNKLAHHVVLDVAECAAAGPTHLALSPGFFRRTWSEEPQWIEGAKAVPNTLRSDGPATTWQELTGDAGWAGKVAEHTLASISGSAAPVAILFPPGLDSEKLLRLLDEAMALIPPNRRWEVTFSTYSTEMPVGTSCVWRCLLSDSPEWVRMRRIKEVLCIDLTAGHLPAAQGGELVAAARSGRNPYLAQARNAAAAVPSNQPLFPAGQSGEEKNNPLAGSFTPGPLAGSTDTSFELSEASPEVIPSWARSNVSTPSSARSRPLPQPAQSSARPMSVRKMATMGAIVALVAGIATVFVVMRLLNPPAAPIAKQPDPSPIAAPPTAPATTTDHTSTTNNTRPAPPDEMLAQNIATDLCLATQRRVWDSHFTLGGKIKESLLSAQITWNEEGNEPLILKKPTTLKDSANGTLKCSVPREAVWKKIQFRVTVKIPGHGGPVSATVEVHIIPFLINPKKIHRKWLNNDDMITLSDNDPIELDASAAVEADGIPVEEEHKGTLKWSWVMVRASWLIGNVQSIGNTTSLKFTPEHGTVGDFSIWLVVSNENQRTATQVGRYHIEPKPSEVPASLPVVVELQFKPDPDPAKKRFVTGRELSDLPKEIKALWDTQKKGIGIVTPAEGVGAISGPQEITLDFPQSEKPVGKWMTQHVHVRSKKDGVLEVYSTSDDAGQKEVILATIAGNVLVGDPASLKITAKNKAPEFWVFFNDARLTVRIGKRPVATFEFIGTRNAGEPPDADGATKEKARDDAHAKIDDIASKLTKIEKDLANPDTADKDKRLLQDEKTKLEAQRDDTSTVLKEANKVLGDFRNEKQKVRTALANAKEAYTRWAKECKD